MVLANSRSIDRVVEAVFNKLVASFPLPVKLEAQDLGLVSEPIGSFVDGVWVESSAIADHDFFFHTVSWLVSSGYVVAAQSFGDREFRNAVLTEKFLQLTNLVPFNIK